MPKHRVEVIDRTYAAILAAKTPAATGRDHGFAASPRADDCLADRVSALFPDAAPEKRRHEYLRRLLGHGTVADLEARG